MAVLPSDEDDRKAARLRLDANVVVEAGAGTGKTTLLTDRILFLLLGRDKPSSVPIGSLVALTFTEKAAGEIKLRLTDRLVELVGALSGGAAAPRAAVFLEELARVFPQAAPKALERAQAALEDMDKAQIGTIHGFASHILRLYPLQAGVAPGFKVDEGGLFDELFDSEWARWLDGELGEAPRSKQEWLALLRLCSLDDLESLARRLCAEGFDLEGAGKPDPETGRWLAEAAARLRRAQEGRPKPRGNSKILQSLEKLAAHLDELGAAALAPQPPLPRATPARDIVKSTWPAGWDEKDGQVYEDMLEISKRCSASSEALLRRAYALLAPFALSFRAAYTKAGLVSFDGLLLKARDLVRDHPDVRCELKRRYACLFVDEFQDTDPLQGELLLLLAEEESGRAPDWRKARLGPGRLFVVGDPKQSIYRFRGADIAAYQDFTARILESGRAFACDLKTNFRSHRGIIDPVNAIFSRTMLLKEGSQPAYKPIDSHAGKRPEGPSLEIVCVGAEKGSKDKPDAGATQRAEAAWAASWVAEHCVEGGVRHKDVAVLLRSASSLAPLLEALKSRGIPYAVEMERFFYGAPEILDLLNLLRTLNDSGDRLALTGLLRSPLVALDDADVYRLARAGRLSYLRDPAAVLSAQAHARLKAFYLRLRSLRERVGRLPLGELVHAALDETALLEVAARAYYGQQTVSNLLKFGRMASSASDERGMTLKEFIDAVARAMNEARPEGESPLADEHLDAVRILSIHKSKGLEFPVVMLMNLSGKRGGASRRPEVIVDWSSGRSGLGLGGETDAVMARLALLEKSRQDDETVRLLYVALTRAKEKLILLGGERGDATSLSRRLEEGGAWPAAEASRLTLGGLEIPVRRLAAGAGAFDRGLTEQRLLKALHPLPAAKELAGRWRLRACARDAALARRWTTSPTAYLGERPESGLAAQEGEAAGRDRSGGAAVGQVCHRVLQGWDFTVAGDPAPAVRAACEQLSRLEPGEDWALVEREVSSILTGFLASETARELGCVEILGREVPILSQEEGVVVRGAIDLLYRKEGRVYVADYKTDRVDEGRLAGLKAKYAAQGAAYCRAVEKALFLRDVSFRLIFLRQGA
jgi:ATP-dependent helicase/nuclease subunit A